MFAVFLNLFRLLKLFSVLIRIIIHHRPIHFSISLMMVIDFAFFSFSAVIFHYQDLFLEIILRLNYCLLQVNLCTLSLMRQLIKFSVSVDLTKRCVLLLDNILYPVLVKFHSNLLNFIWYIILNNLLIDFVYFFSGIPGIKFACPSRPRLSEVFLIYMYYSPTFDTDVLLL